MSGKIFRSILTVAIGTLLVTLLIITGCMYGYFGTVQENLLLDELSIAAQGTETAGEAFLTGLDSDNYRITWIAADGAVLFDNRADAAAMENHADREEIKAAFASGRGSSSRYSTTLTEKTLYEAVKLSDGTVLRISVSQVTVVVLLLGMIQPILLVAMLVIILSAILGKRMAKRIVEPLNRLDLERPMENDVYEELSPLLRRIDAQHREIRQQLTSLKQRRNEFTQITESMREGLVLLDNAGRIVSMNPAAKKLFHADRDSIGKDFLTLCRDQDMRRSIDEAEEVGHAELRTDVNGQEYQFDLSRIESDGEPMGEVILAFDITERAEAERSRREFTANVSHELKTPLQGILGYADLISNGLAKSEDIPRFAAHIRGEATRLVTLIEDIIRLSQLDEGADLPQEEVSLPDIAKEVCRSLTDQAEQRNIAITVNAEGGVLFGVRRLLHEIVYNLCDNAIKYNKPGGNVCVGVSEDAHAVRLTVSDTGIGIAPEHQTRIFERFYRVDKSHSRQSGGTGLGLSIVKHAAAYHHGKIEVDSEPGRGTAITITLPKNRNKNEP